MASPLPGSDEIDCVKVSRRQSNTLPRDFRLHEEPSLELVELPKFSTIPRSLPSHVGYGLPKRKGGLPRLLRFLCKKKRRQLKYCRQEGNTTEGQRWRRRSASRASTRLLFDVRRSSGQRQFSDTTLTLGNVSMSPILGNTPLTDSASGSDSQLEILNVILRDSIYVSETLPTWSNQENIKVIAHINHLSQEKDRLTFKLGQQIEQVKGADDNGLAYGTIKTHRFSKTKSGFYPASYVIPKPPKVSRFARFFRKKQVISDLVLSQIQSVYETPESLSEPDSSHALSSAPAQESMATTTLATRDRTLPGMPDVSD